MLPDQILASLKTSLLTLCFILFSGYWSFAQHSLNELLATCRKAKTETEDNGRMLKTFFHSNPDKFQTGMKLYNQARASFEEWIEFYKLEVTATIQDKDKQADHNKISSKIETALNDVASFNAFYNNISVADNSSPVAYKAPPVISEVNACLNSAVSFIRLIKDSRREKQQILKNDLYDQLSRYHIISFTELK